MATPPFITSLHRPFNQPLKVTRLVCDFINEQKKPLASSVINIEFYFHLLDELSNLYAKNAIKDFTGLPSKEAIVEVIKAFELLKKPERIEFIKDAVRKKNKSALEKQIYSTYKSASYYVNFTKDKLGLVDKNNTLTEDGKTLLAIESSFTNYKQEEKDFYYKKLLEVDFLLLITLCLFKRLSYEYKFSDYIENQFDFLDDFYGIRHFNFTKSSLENYNTVRNFWLSTLDLLDKRMIIRKNYQDVIHSNESYSQWYKDLIGKFNLYVGDKFKKEQLYNSQRSVLEERYCDCIKEGKGELGFVNLYDLKEGFRMSFETFQSFVNKYYENEKRKKHIFFSNIVSSIDRRKRFDIRGIPVLKMKIK
ncbi:hypothetical protein AB6805_08325 [Chitinophaga sp. RCC_12]|uniref:hypothetical protein n=1 Tax=Chitinophaga sp. RCC_12 TaxID=3239226 RepID=UPI003523DB37